LDALFRLMRSSNFNAEDVNSVDVVTSSGALALLLLAPPRSGMEAKFSMSYAIASALLDGKIGLSSFTDEAVNRPKVRKLMKRITARESDGEMLPRFATITLRLRNGEVVSQRVDALHGSPSSPLSEPEFLEKIEDCLSWGGSLIRGKAVMSATANIAKLDVRSLVAALMAPAHSARSANGRTL
jgi:2-methylcitrate dehydratase PrpD